MYGCVFEHRLGWKMEELLSAPDNGVVAHRIREELARRRMTRQHLADLAKLSLSTLEKSLSGQRSFSLATIVRLEEAFAVRLRPADQPAFSDPNVVLVRTARVELGAYARRSVQWLEGEYQTLRPSISQPGSVYAYKTVISWDDAAACLVFQESERQDSAYHQSGLVSVSNLSGHIYLMTNKEGQFRLVVASRPTPGGAIYGLITSLVSGKGAHLTPFASPIAYVPARNEASAICGVVSPADPAHQGLRQHIDRVLADGFATMLTQ